MNDKEKRTFGMTQYPPPQHIVPGGPELGYFQSDDLWTPQQVEQWKKNWLSDARPEPVEKAFNPSEINLAILKVAGCLRMCRDFQWKGTYVGQLEEAIDQLCDVTLEPMERDSSEDQAKTHMLVNFIEQTFGINVVWDPEKEHWVVGTDNSISNRVIYNGDKLI